MIIINLLKLFDGGVVVDYAMIQGCKIGHTNWWD